MKSLCILAVLMFLVVSGCSNPPPKAKADAEPIRNAADMPSATQSVDAQLGEWFIKLDPTSIPAGVIKINIKNTGSVTHALEIKGQDVDQRSTDIQPGDSDTLQVNLETGTYEAFCPIGQHKDNGMSATLIVTGAAGKSPSSTK
ncbi:MAG TPA: cupredoxin domain-containing protein [Armatimonadota bacterium]|jgi:uncharacterized cupredoxin-like copper-binding protein